MPFVTSCKSPTSFFQFSSTQPSGPRAVDSILKEIEVSKIREAAIKLKSGPIGADGNELLCMTFALSCLGKSEEFHFVVTDYDNNSTVFSNTAETGFCCHLGQEGVTSEKRFKINWKPSKHGSNSFYLRCQVELADVGIFEANGKNAFVIALCAGLKQKDPSLLGREEIKKFRSTLVESMNNNAEQIAFYWMQAKANGLIKGEENSAQLLPLPSHAHQMEQEPIGPFPYAERWTPFASMLMLATTVSNTVNNLPSLPPRGAPSSIFPPPRPNAVETFIISSPSDILVPNVASTSAAVTSGMPLIKLVSSMMGAASSGLNSLASWMPNFPTVLPGAEGAFAPKTTDLAQESADVTMPMLYQEIVDRLVDERVRSFLTTQPDTQYKVAVKSFQSGNLFAQRVSLGGNLLPGVFLIPFDKGGVLLSVLNRENYLVETKEYAYLVKDEGILELLTDHILDRLPDRWQNRRTTIPHWPTSQKFQAWVNNALPPTSEEHFQPKFVVSRQVIKKGGADMYSLKNPQNKKELAKQLFIDLDSAKKADALHNAMLSEPDMLIGLLAEAASSQDMAALHDYTVKFILPQRVSELYASAYPPISNPSFAIDQEIMQRLHDYEKQHGSTGLNPYSSVEIHIQSSGVHGNKMTDKKVTVTLRERLTGVYSSPDVSYRGIALSVKETNPFYRKLIEDLRLLPDLKDKLRAELAQYENNAASKAAIKLLYKGEIMQCLYNLLDDQLTPAFRSMVDAVLTGKSTPYSVNFHGNTLARIFAVKTDDGFLLFDMTRKSAVTLGSAWTKVPGDDISNEDGYQFIEHLEEKKDQSFIDLILNNLPIKKRIEYNKLESFKIEFLSVPDGDARFGLFLWRAFHPFSFEEMPGLNELVEKLESVHFQNTSSDLDSLARSYSEGVVKFALRQAELVLRTVSPLVMMLPTGGGALIYRLGALTMKLAVTSSSIAVAGLQKATALTNEEEDEASEHLILACVFGLIDLAVPGRNLAHLMGRKQFFPALIHGEMLWHTMVHHGQLGLLMKYIQQHSMVSSILAKRFGQTWLSKIASSIISRTTVRTFSEADNALQPVLSKTLGEYQKMYPLTFRRARPVNLEIVREPIRETVVTSTPSLVLPPALSNAHSELGAIPSIRNMMQMPAENCEAILVPIIRYMQSKGMSHIQVRGMFIWANGGEMMPANHFVVRGYLDGQDYVFDLTAAQFIGIDRPLILPLATWEQQYQQAWKLKLIKYQDFKSIEGANAIFGSQILIQAPMDLIPGAQVLAAPGWYKAQLQIAAPSASMPVISDRHTPLDLAVKASISSHTGTPPWGFPAVVFEKGQVLNSAQAKSLVTQFQQLARSQNADISCLFQTYGQLTCIDDALRVPSGQLLVFVKEGGPVHTMVSLGGGRFAGMKNDVLNPALGGGKQIVFAEQLGKFEGNKLVPWQNSKRLELVPQDQSMTVYAGVPRGGASAPSVLEIATRNMANQPSRQGLPQLTTILEEARILAPEQAAAFERQARLALMRGPLDPMVDWRSLISLPQKVTTPAALRTLPKGGIIVSAHSEPPAIMVHLGEGHFASADLIKSPAASPIKILKAEEITLSSQLLAGQINIQNLRMSTLLGTDAAFYLEGSNKLVIRAHGAPTITNYMAAPELANGVRALMLAKQLRGDAVRGIHLESCWGGFGSWSTGQILANEFNVPVTSYRWRYSARTADDVVNRVTFKPMPAKTPQDLQRLADLVRAHEKSHEFWNKLLMAISARRSKRAVPEAGDVNWKEAYPQFSKLASLVLQEQTIEVFLTENPWFFGGDDLNLSEEARNMFKIKMKEVLGTIVMPTDGMPITDELFKKRCEELMTLNPYTYAYLLLLLE